jgi:DNA invertase Pin-like site-specific DNA recombinase
MINLFMRDLQVGPDEVAVAGQGPRGFDHRVGRGWQMQLLAEITANLVGHVGQGGQIAQMLVTFEEYQEGQMLGRSSRMGGDKGLFLLGRRVEPLEFGGGERRREAGVGGAFNRSHRRSRPPAVSEKGCPGRGVASLVFPGETAYRKPVRQARPFRTGYGGLIEGRRLQTALYLRVSTAQQRPDLQDDGLRAYAARAGFAIVATYVDHAVSGRQEGRPQLQALMRAARQHAFACVLVWKFDRFARSVAHLLRALEEFDSLGIRFISVQDQVDTASPMGKAMFTIIGAMAELESALISERVKAGMAAARARGKSLGRPAPPAPLVAQIEGLAATTSLSIRQIHAVLVGRVSRSVVGAVVKRVRTQVPLVSL